MGEALPPCPLSEQGGIHFHSAAMSPQRKQPCSSRETSFERPCVLIVDDEIAIRLAIGRYFARQGWDVREASDGEAAQRLLEPNADTSFDVLICDLRMPRFSASTFVAG